ncbi:MAG: hypothetical protein M1607_04235 [Patescibacteria group bacterium]|nr:hypothetical protein [Patescibacteria group bacterium]
MSSEFHLSYPDIARAEDLRLKGDYVRAIQPLCPIYLLGLDRVQELSDQQKSLYLSGLRIYQVVEQTQTKRAWYASSVVSYLSWARDIAMKYINPSVKSIAQSPLPDPSGQTEKPLKTIVYWPEMLRDLAEYDTLLARLTGQAKYYQQAEGLLRSGEDFAQSDLTRRSRQFDLARLMNHDHSSHNPASFLYSIFEDIARQCEKDGNWDRLATYASRMMVSALHDQDLTVASKTLRWLGFVNSQEKHTAMVFGKTVMKEIVEPLQTACWQKTGRGQDYSRLELPS